MSNQRYVMTLDQIKELQQLDLPLCPSAFQFVKGNFRKYKAYMKLPAFRIFGYGGSDDLEDRMGDIWLKGDKYK